MKELLKLFKSQTPTVQIIIGVIVLYLLYNAYHWLKAEFSKDAADAQNKVEIKQLENQGITASFSDSEFMAMADDLEEAMTGPSNYEDAEKVYAVLQKLENDADFIELNKAFGLRASNWDWINPTSTDLKTWLRDESLIDMEKINTQLGFQGLSKRF